MKNIKKVATDAELDALVATDYNMVAESEATGKVKMIKA